MESTEVLRNVIRISPEVETALVERKAVVALESTVITHGLPYPQNLELAQQMEQEVRAEGAIPATIAVIQGEIRIGVDTQSLLKLATEKDVLKISGRDFAFAITHRRSGGTTVAATMVAANLTGIKVFATGGIGGVHRNAPFDVSADLIELSRTPMVVVCAGAKAILDLPATLEMLETFGVPVIGYQTNTFPAFYSQSIGLPVSGRVDSPTQAAHLASTHWGLGFQGAVLLVQPPPLESSLPEDVVQKALDQALAELHARGIRGQEVTPFLLSRVSFLTEGRSMQSNLALLRNNARLAAQVIVALRKIDANPA
jgi:pseudouridine-5'-phosphate glycosidase